MKSTSAPIWNTSEPAERADSALQSTSSNAPAASGHMTACRPTGAEPTRPLAPSADTMGVEVDGIAPTKKLRPPLVPRRETIPGSGEGRTHGCLCAQKFHVEPSAHDRLSSPRGREPIPVLSRADGRHEELPTHHVRVCVEHLQPHHSRKRLHDLPDRPPALVGGRIASR